MQRGWMRQGAQIPLLALIWQQFGNHESNARLSPPIKFDTLIKFSTAHTHIPHQTLHTCIFRSLLDTHRPKSEIALNEDQNVENQPNTAYKVQTFSNTQGIM